MKCAVWNCNNRRSNKDKISFFTFPTEKKLHNKWVQFCRRDRPFNANTWKICMAHFNPEDIEGNLMYQMGLCINRRVRPGAIPCIHKESPIEQQRTKRIQKRNNKKIVDMLIRESNKVNVDTETNHTEEPAPTFQTVYNLEDFMGPAQTQIKALILKPIKILYVIQTNAPNAETQAITTAGHENSSLQENLSESERVELKYEESDDSNDMCEFLPENSSLPSTSCGSKQNFKSTAASIEEEQFFSKTIRKTIESRKETSHMVLSTAKRNTIEFLKEEISIVPLKQKRDTESSCTVENSLTVESVVTQYELEPDDANEMCTLIEQVLSDSPSTSCTLENRLICKTEFQPEFENIEIESDEEFLSEVPPTISTYSNKST